MGPAAASRGRQETGPVPLSVELLEGRAVPALVSAGTFGSGINSPHDVAVGDVNGDGRPDAVLANGAAGTEVLLGNGDGTFHLGTTWHGGAGIHSLAVADFDGDGRPDVVTAGNPGNSSGGATVLVNDGLWAPLPPPPSISNGGGGGGPGGGGRG